MHSRCGQYICLHIMYLQSDIALITYADRRYFEHRLHTGRLIHMTLCQGRFIVYVPC